MVKRWDSLEKWIAGVIMLFALCLSFYSVVARYVFHWSLDWSDEIAVYAVIWAIFFGVSSLIKIDEHVRVDILIAVSLKNGKIFSIFITPSWGWHLLRSWSGEGISWCRRHTLPGSHRRAT